MGRKTFFIIILMVFIIMSCATTEYKTKNQLPENVQFFDSSKVFEMPVTKDFLKYPICPYESSIESEMNKLEEAKKLDGFLYTQNAKIIGSFFYSKSGCNPTFYIAEVEGYGFLFIEERMADKIKFENVNAAQIAEDKAEMGKADDFIDKLKTADRELFNSVKYGDYDQMVMAINYKANIEVRDYYGMTPLMVASQNGFDVMAKYLLDHNANVNAATKYNTTSLMLAAMNGNSKIVSLLIAYGAKLNIKDKTSGMTAYEMAKINNHTEVMFLLKASGAK